jgi:hypothetical protein
VALENTGSSGANRVGKKQARKKGMTDGHALPFETDEQSGGYTLFGPD